MLSAIRTCRLGHGIMSCSIVMMTFIMIGSSLLPLRATEAAFVAVSPSARTRQVTKRNDRLVPLNVVTAAGIRNDYVSSKSTPRGRKMNTDNGGESVRQPKQQQNYQTNHKTKMMSYVAALCVSGLAIFGNDEWNKAAWATGYGPAGATMSPPPGLSAAPSKKSDPKQKSTRLKKIFGSSLNNDAKSMEELSLQLESMCAGLASPENKDLYTDVKEEEPAVVAAAENTNAAAQEASTGDKPASPQNLVAEESQKAQQQVALAKEAIEKKKEEGMKMLEEEQLLMMEQEMLLVKLEQQPYWFDYTAAFVGSVASTLIMHPVDTIKTRIQVRAAKKGAQNKANSTAAEGSNDSDGDDEEDDGPITSNLYQGLTGNIFKEGPSSALSLSVYEVVKLALLRAAPASNQKLNLFSVYLLAGAAGELVGSVIQAPAEVVKSLLQSRTAESPTEAISIVLGRPQGVIQAWSAAIWRDVPFSAIQLTVFELVKAYILENPDQFNHFDSTTLLAEAVIGAFAGGCGALLTNPTDVITARIITQQKMPMPEDDVDFTPTNGETKELVCSTTNFVSEGDAKTVGFVSRAKEVYQECEDDTNPVSTMTATAVMKKKTPLTSNQDVPFNQESDEISDVSTKELLGVVGMAKQIYQEGGSGAFFVGWQARVGYWAPAISIFLTTYCSIRQAGITYDLFG